MQGCQREHGDQGTGKSLELNGAGLIGSLRPFYCAAQTRDPGEDRGIQVCIYARPSLISSTKISSKTLQTLDKDKIGPRPY